MLNIFPRYIEKFKKNVMPHLRLERGIYTSEAFAFCAICEALGVDMIIESGVWHGNSTIIWAKYFKDNPNFIIKAIDLDIQPEASTVLWHYRSVDLFEGDSWKLVPTLITNYLHKKIAVFIDGPKYERALKMGFESFQWPHVRVVGMHDMPQYKYREPNSSRVTFESMVKSIPHFSTDDEEFCEAYKTMDLLSDGKRPSLNEQWNLVEDGLYKQGWGPTVSIIMKDNPR